MKRILLSLTVSQLEVIKESLELVSKKDIRQPRRTIAKNLLRLIGNPKSYLRTLVYRKDER